MNPYLNSYVSVFAHPKPSTITNIRGNSGNPLPKGDASFYSIPTGGILIQAEVFRLPDQRLPDRTGFFGMHIHENGDCRRLRWGNWLRGYWGCCLVFLLTSFFHVAILISREPFSVPFWTYWRGLFICRRSTVLKLGKVYVSPYIGSFYFLLSIR